MRVFHSTSSSLHDPDRFFRRGAFISHPEQAARYLVLRDAVAAANHDLIEPGDAGIDPIRAVHDSGYVAFLHDAWTRRAELGEVEDEILTGHFARPQMHRQPTGMLGLIGLYTADTSTPIRAGTWAAAYGSAQTAIAAADAALAHGQTYALCRPPGHHAYANSAGGFCYLNNAAISADRLSRLTGTRVGILDIDVHHGNGTQGIFYERSDVLTVSIHADPANYFPFFAGYPDERGQGEGFGFNRNIALPHGSGDDVWCAAITEALELFASKNVRSLVVSLGLDASEHDPLGVLKVTRKGFERAGRLVGSTGLPTAMIQEGGYLCDALPLNLTTFLAAVESAASRS